MTLNIIEVMSRSEQGRTQPYICRGDDGMVYFVKGRIATRHGLINEWLCANLALAFGLPIAPFGIATVPHELMEADISGFLSDLGEGAVFVSQRVEGTELTHSQAAKVQVATQNDVLMFDWWVRNQDRCLTQHGGNVNLLWAHARTHTEALGTSQAAGLTVIDHNLAFDATFSKTQFCKGHVFAPQLPTIFSNFLTRQSYAERYASALSAVWDSACGKLPQEWFYIDDEQTLPTNFPFEQIKQSLDAANHPDFWNLPS
jgi:hypothetical protein